MAFFLLLTVALFSWLTGRAALHILYGNLPGNDITRADEFLTGGMIIIGLAEAAHLGILLLGRSFSDCIKLFWILGGICLAAAVTVEFFFRKNPSGKQNRTGKIVSFQSEKPEKKTELVYLAFALLALSQLIYIVMSQEVYRQGDMTVETVNSFLDSNTIYQVNPLTGQAYETGIPLRLRILCLPTLYGILCSTFGLSAVQLVWGLVPVFTLAGAYLAYFGIAKRLFAGSAAKRGIFLAAAALLLWAGDYMYGMDGFGLLHSGFRGVVIRSLVLLPYTFDLCMRKKWKLVVLCILAEACMVWTLYGMGACLFAAAGMFAIQKLLEKRKERTGGKETSKWKSF